MRKRRLILPAIPLSIGALVLAGCAVTTTPAATTVADASASSGEVVIADTTGTTAEAVLAANEDATVVRDDEWSAADAVDITFTGSSATTTAEGVEVSGSAVTITAAGVYRLSGSLDGSVTVSRRRTRRSSSSWTASTSRTPRAPQSL
jgi:hypothetical protein